MRVIVMFDLPMLTDGERKNYRRFRKFRIKEGFYMMQESVYCKLVQNTTAGDTVIEHLRKNKPAAGLVQVLKVTERQFAKMEYLVGKKKSEMLDSDERLVVL